MKATLLHRNKAYSFQQTTDMADEAAVRDEQESRLFMSLKSLVHWIEAWRRYRTAVSELSQLSERELADLGLSRDEIHEVARQTSGL